MGLWSSQPRLIYNVGGLADYCGVIMNVVGNYSMSQLWIVTCNISEHTQHKPDPPLQCYSNEFLWYMRNCS